MLAGCGCKFTAGEAALNGAADGYMMGAITGFISGGMTSNQCFVAGTAILTSSGYVAIENIRAGDMVWASDPETGETELKPVVRTFRNETTELVHVTVNGEEIICTNEHPFYSPVKGWTAACQLRAGDILVLVNGEYVVVEEVQHELLESTVATYNFEVQDFHTYYVGEQSILVHNLCGPLDAKTTNHGSIRVGERGLTQREYDLLKASKNVKTQADGARVYIRSLTSNNNNVLIENTRGEIVTFMKNVTKHGLKNLAKNYGWF